MTSSIVSDRSISAPAQAGSPRRVPLRQTGDGGVTPVRPGSRGLGVRLAPYLYVVPLLAFIGLFIYWPMVYSLFLSLMDWNLVSPDIAFVGLGNFRKLFTSREFLIVIRNTAIYLAILVPFLVVAPLLIAELLWPIRRSRLQPIYRGVLFAPTAVAAVVSSVVWLWILDPLQGVLTGLVLQLGGPRIDWLTQPVLAFACVTAVSAWKLFGFNLLIYLAALEAIPEPILEAATLDGAQGWQQFRHIRVPLLAPTLFFTCVTTVIFVSDDIFQILQVLTRGGPFGQTQNILYFLYQWAFRYFQVGYGSAIAVVTFAVVMALTWLQFRTLGRRVRHD